MTADDLNPLREGWNRALDVAQDDLSAALAEPSAVPGGDHG